MSDVYSKIGTIIGNQYTPRLQGSTTTAEALEIMDEYEITAIGVECECDFIGVFTRTDFEKQVLRWNLHPGETTLYEVITFNPPYVTPDLSVKEVYNAMLAYQVKAMPIVSGKTLIGIADLDILRNHINESRNNILEDNVTTLKHFGSDKTFLPEHIAAKGVALQ